MSHEATFYDPPDDIDLGEPIPEQLREAAATLVGKRMMIADAVAILRKSVWQGAFDIADDFISFSFGTQMYLPCAEPGLLVWQYNYRVLRMER